MKNFFALSLATAALISCGNNENKPAATNTPATQAPPEKKAVDPEVDKGETLIAQSDCLGCHKIDERFVGPSYKEVAQKYAGQGGAIGDTLAQRIIKGIQPGEGPWGTGQIMTAHPTLPEADAKAMVKYVMSLK